MTFFLIAGISLTQLEAFRSKTIALIKLEALKSRHLVLILARIGQVYIPGGCGVRAKSIASASRLTSSWPISTPAACCRSVEGPCPSKKY